MQSLQYVTCLLPLSEQAELTQFASNGSYLSYPGLIMFDGRVWHRGPRVGHFRRLVLALVACAGSDVNHDSSTPFRTRPEDWTPGESEWHLEATRDSLQLHRRGIMTPKASPTRLEGNALTQATESGIAETDRKSVV